eukprot:scaffold480_cov257-Pinguiococcus_pyrenoidosus.AAC.10
MRRRDRDLQATATKDPALRPLRAGRDRTGCDGRAATQQLAPGAPEVASFYRCVWHLVCSPVCAAKFGSSEAKPGCRVPASAARTLREAE